MPYMCQFHQGTAEASVLVTMLGRGATVQACDDDYVPMLVTLLAMALETDQAQLLEVITAHVTGAQAPAPRTTRARRGKGTSAAAAAPAAPAAGDDGAQGASEPTTVGQCPLCEAQIEAPADDFPALAQAHMDTEHPGQQAMAEAEQ